MKKKNNHLKTAAAGATSPMAPVDWSELPKDILNLISERLNDEFELIRFRSVCSNWRSSVSNLNTKNLPFNFPLKFDSTNNNSTTNISFCSLSKRNIFLIKPLQQTRNRRPVLIRVTQNSSGKSKRSPFLPFDLPCPFSIDLTKFSVHHFGTNFIIDGSLSYNYIQPVKVVAVTPLVLAILLYNSDLVLLHCGDERWTEIPYTPSSIGEICLFKGQVYAVERFSRKTVTVTMEDLSVQLVAKGVDEAGGAERSKFLVESEGELLLVDPSDSLYCKSFYSDTLTIDVFRLDEKEKEWVKLTSLGDRVLFLNYECSFSASALDLCVTKGNCVILMDNFIITEYCEGTLYVFDMDLGRLLPLHHYPHYVNLLWPAPDWIDNNCIRKNTKQRALSPYTGAKQRKRT